MGESQIFYDMITKDLEKKKLERKKKEEILRRYNEINQMDKERALIQLSKTKELYKMIEFNLNRKKKEIKLLKQNEEVRKYILLESSIDDMIEELESTREELSLLKQKTCDHELVYLISYPKKSLAYVPNFKCLSCGKNLIGFLNKEQICVNNEFLKDTDRDYSGSYSEFLELLVRNSDLKSEGLNLDERFKVIYNELKKKHKNSKKIELKRKEKSD